MRQCRTMKRHVTGLRWDTGFLIVMLCLQVSLRVIEATNGQEKPEGKAEARAQKGDQPQKDIRHVNMVNTVHLLTAIEDGQVVPLNEKGFYTWMVKHNTRNIFKLEDNSTTLIVPKKGLYLVNLKMYYYISPVAPECEENLFLSTYIKQYHSSYPEWMDVIKGLDTMRCEKHWRQSVTLSQVVRFKRGTKLRVKIEPKNYAYIIGDSSTYFSVTLL